ncbi:MAG: hypothetical protein H0T42_18815 [Deltaproteobacteria bacterium]|nr:hypothetical protein [Deltaproteobacteria bacterium]
MSLPLRVCVVVFGSLVAVGPVDAGPVIGKLDLPKEVPMREASATKGFLDRVENPLAPPRPVAVTPYLVVVLEQAEGAQKGTAPGQVVWELVGESFARPVVIAPIGAEVLIKNVSKTARTLVALEDAGLVPSGPINPTGPKSFRIAEAKVYTIADKDAAHLRGTIVGVTSPYVATVDETGKFEIADVPEGNYKLRIFYKTDWLEGTTDVAVSGKGKTEVAPKVPALNAPKKK